MKIKFNQFERVAGLFVLMAIGGSIAASVAVAVKRGWFERKIALETHLSSADGVHIGTMVQMAGLRAGSVTSVDLKNNNQILVRFEVSERFHARIHEDSVVRIMRPFIIGEKVLDVSVGTEQTKNVPEGQLLASEASADIMDLVSGKTLGPYLETMGKMMENLKFVAEAFLDPERSKAIVKIFDELNPLIRNMSSMGKEATGLIRQLNGKQQLVTTVNNLVALTTELNTVMPQFTKNSPELAADLSKIAKNMAVLTDEMQKFLPLMSQMAPEIPHASKRALEALDETVVTLKALQKSFLLRGSVKDVREEEAKERQPASEPKK